MKKFIFSFTLILIVIKSFSQETPSPSFSKDYYLDKSKNQKTTGWVLLIGGSLMGVIGIAKAKQIANDPNISFSGGFGSATGWAIIASTGGTLALCSIAFFINSRKYARKAATISFNNQQMLSPQRNSFVLKSQPTFTLKLVLK